jgi:hypothetical protein
MEQLSLINLNGSSHEENYTSVINLDLAESELLTYEQSLRKIGLLSTPLNVFLVSVGLIGIIGNGISGFIFTRKSMKAYTINKILLGLTIWDSCYTLGFLYSTGVFSVLVSGITGKNFHRDYYWPMMQGYAFPVFATSRWGEAKIPLGSRDRTCSYLHGNVCVSHWAVLFLKL